MQVPFVKLQQRGALMVMFAILLPVMILFVGLALDFGILYLERNKLQDVADATALAGAAHMQDENNGLAEEIVKYVKLNDDDFGNVQTNELVTSLTLTQWGNKAAIGVNDAVLVEYGVTGPLTSAKFEDNDRVRVRLTKRVPIFFLGSLLGDNEANGVAVSVMAAAKGLVKAEPTPPIRKETVTSIASGGNLNIVCGSNSIKTPPDYQMGVYVNENINNEDIAKLLDSNYTDFYMPNYNLSGETFTSDLSIQNVSFSDSEKRALQDAGLSESKAKSLTGQELYAYREDPTLSFLFTKALDQKPGTTTPAGAKVVTVFRTIGDNQKDKYAAELWYYKNGAWSLRGNFYSISKLIDGYQWNQGTVDQYFAYERQLALNAKASVYDAEKGSLELAKQEYAKATNSITNFQNGVDGKRYMEFVTENNKLVVRSNILSSDKNIEEGIDLYIDVKCNQVLLMNNTWLNGVTKINNLYVSTPNGHSFYIETNNVTYGNIFANVETVLSIAGQNNIYKGVIGNIFQNGHLYVLADNSKFMDGYQLLASKEIYVGKGFVHDNNNSPMKTSGVSTYNIEIRKGIEQSANSGFSMELGDGWTSPVGPIPTPVPTTNTKITLIE